MTKNDIFFPEKTLEVILTSYRSAGASTTQTTMAALRELFYMSIKANNDNNNVVSINKDNDDTVTQVLNKSGT